MMDELSIELWHLILAFIICGIIVKALRRPSDKVDSRIPEIPGIPFIGNAHQLKPRSIAFELTDLAEKYGNIFTISLFGKKFVVVSDTDLLLALMKTSSKADAFAGRPNSSYVFKRTQICKSIMFRDWSSTLQHLRKIAIHAITMVGEQRKQMERLIEEEAETLVEILDAYDGKPVDPQLDINTSIVNIISVLCMGKRFSREDPDLGIFLKITDLANQVMCPGFGAELEIISFLRYLPIRSKRIMDELIHLRDQFINKYYNEIKDTFQNDSLRCMTDHMIKSMYENPDGDIDDEIIKSVMLDIIVGGDLTTSNTLYTAIAILVNRQDLQQRLQGEIDTVIGRNQVTQMRHKADMHFMQAFILELLRYASIVLLTTRKTTQNSYLNSFYLQKGTRLLLNIYGCNRDPMIWKDPYTVDPDRFLDENGHLVPPDHPNRKRLLVFGIGKRSCLGEGFAKNRLFLFLSVLLQRFNFLPLEDKPAPIANPRQYIPGIAITAPPYQITIVRRD